MNRALTSLAFVVTAATLATTAHSYPIAIYNTGVNASGSGLATNGSADSHWKAAPPAAPSAPTSAYVYDNSHIAGGWKTDSGSQWISPAVGNYRNAGGQWSYQTTFNLAGFNPATDSAVLNGNLAADDCLMDILINGTSLGIHSGTGGTCVAANSIYNKFFTFTINTGFISGLNTLTFEIWNLGTGSSPTGMNLQINGTVKVPEPAQLGLLGLLLLGLGGLWLRRRW